MLILTKGRNGNEIEFGSTRFEIVRHPPFKYLNYFIAPSIGLDAEAYKRFGMRPER